MISWSFEYPSSSCQPWYVCLICCTPNYCHHTSFCCCQFWFCNVMQGVLYPHTGSTPCLSSNFCQKYRGDHCPSFVKKNFLAVKLVHAQHYCYSSPSNVDLLDYSWDICSPQLCSRHSDSFWASHLSYCSFSRRCMRGTFPLHLFKFQYSYH